MLSEENFIKLKALATVWNKLDKYVWLREDDKGRYIEYAFIEGTPHDNRCLSWYDKPHPNYFKKHPNLSQGRINTVNELYKLHEFCCGLSDKEGTEHCSAGHPKEDCDYITAVEELVRNGGIGLMTNLLNVHVGLWSLLKTLIWKMLKFLLIKHKSI